VGSIVYLPCLSGTAAVDVAVSPPGLRMSWKSSVGGGPPIVAADLVWTIGQNGMLYGLDLPTGAVRQEATIGVPANHFPTPSVGDGLLLAPSADRVIAFRAVAEASTPVPSTTGTRPATNATVPKTASRSRPLVTSTPRGRGGNVAKVLAGIVAGVVVLLSAATSIVRRRRRGRASAASG